MKTHRRPSLRLALVAFALLSLAHAVPADPAASSSPHPDRAREVVETLSRYLAVDTTNPPGNEMRTARFLKAVCDRESIENEIIDLGGGRANFVARLRGDGSRRPLVLLHHMDVVPADPAHWKRPPFGGQVASGEIWGRGAIDVKTKGIVDLMTLVALKRARTPLKRDLVLLAVADEEAASLGARALVKDRLEIVRGAEILLDEGACVRAERSGSPLLYPVAIGEKSSLWLTIRFKGQPGHGSMPRPDSAVDRAVRAAARILAAPTELRLLPALREGVRALVGRGDWRALPGARATLDASLESREFLKAISREPRVNAFLRDTVAITQLAGSSKINVVPNEASIGLDCRLLPGTRPREFLERIRTLVADPTASIDADAVDLDRVTMLSPVDGPFVAALRKAALARNPAAWVVPIVLTSTTDSALFRPLGIHCYGFEPYPITDEEEERSHGNDERMRVDSIAFGLDLLIGVIEELNR